MYIYRVHNECQINKCELYVRASDFIGNPKFTRISFAFKYLFIYELHTSRESSLVASQNSFLVSSLSHHCTVFAPLRRNTTSRDATAEIGSRSAPRTSVAPARFRFSSVTSSRSPVTNREGRGPIRSPLCVRKVYVCRKIN